MSHLMFPRLYSAYVSQFTEDLRLWRSMASSQGGSILELGCGPGRVLAELAKWNFRVTGLDNDPEMLQWTRTNIPSHLLDQVNLVEADMRRFNLEQRFPLIIIPCNTFAYFHDQDAHQVLSCIRQHLTPNGQAILVVPNPDRPFATFRSDSETEVSPDEPIFLFIEPVSGNPVQVYAVERPDIENKIIHVTWAFDELSPDGRVQRYPYEISYHLRLIEDTTSLIEGAGLSLRELFGDYRFGSFKPTSDELIFIVGLQP